MRGLGLLMAIGFGALSLSAGAAAQTRGGDVDEHGRPSRWPPQSDFWTPSPPAASSPESAKPLAKPAEKPARPDRTPARRSTPKSAAK